jgi:ABC-type branched-subunit amino acid transport system substrate-binding protein
MVSTCSTKQKPIIREDILEFEQKTVGSVNNRFNIGVFLPLSGNSSNIGQSIFNAIQLALYQNTPNNISVHFIDIADKNFDIGKTILDLKAKKVQLLVGPIYASDTQKVMPIARALSVSLISFSNNTELLKSGVMIIGLSPENQTKLILKYIKNYNLATQYFIFIPKNEYGNKIDEVVKKHFANSKDSYKILYYKERESLENAFLAFSSQISEQKEGEKNAIIFPDDSSNLEYFIEQISGYEINQKNNIQVFLFDNWDESSNDFGDKTQDVKIYQIKRKQILYNDFAKNYINFYQKPLSNIGALAYDTINLLINMRRYNQPINYNNLVNFRDFTYQQLNYIFKEDGSALHKLPIIKYTTNNSYILTDNYDLNELSLIKDKLD